LLYGICGARPAVESGGKTAEGGTRSKREIAAN
jgi:hypothetical protein